MRNKILLLFSLIFIQNGFSQTDKKEDSLLNKSYKYLEGKIKNSSVKNEHKSIYIDTYLNKAKKEKDTVNIGFGFYFKIIENLHDYSDSSIKGIAINERGLIYSDSIINYTKNIEHKTFPGLGYIIKGYLFFNLGNEKKSLNNYLIAYKYAQKHDNKTQLADIKDVIDIIKNDIKSTLKETKEELDSLLIKKKEGKVDLYYYLSTLKNHINDLQKEKKYTKAADYIDLGISESINLKAKEKEHYYTFVFSSGINYFLLKNHNQALDSINKAENMLDLYSLQLAYYLKGKIYTERDTTVALQYFNKVDSIFQINNTNMYGLFDNYKSLIAIHKANNNYGKQIENIDKLIYADSIVNANKLDYEEKILHQYEIPKYKHEKEKIILDLEEKKRESYFLFKSCNSLSIIV